LLAASMGPRTKPVRRAMALSRDLIAYWWLRVERTSGRFHPIWFSSTGAPSAAFCARRGRRGR